MLGSDRGVRLFRLLCAGAILVPAAAAFAQPAGQPPAPVVVSPVVQAEVAASQSYVGTVEPSQRAVIGSAVDGRVWVFPLKSGDAVEDKGVLAEILTATIKLELKAAEAERDLRDKELEELTNGTRPQEKTRAEAEMLAAEASMKLAQSNLERTRNFFREGTVTQAVLDSEASAFNVAQAMHAEKVAANELAIAGPRTEMKAQAEARLRMNEAMVEKLEDQIKKYTIRSRFKGYVVAEHTEVGSWVNKGDPVAEVVALERVNVVVRVLEAHVPYVEPGMTVPVTIPALNRIYTGRVVRVVPQADVRTRTFPVEIRVDNEFDTIEIDADDDGAADVDVNRSEDATEVVVDESTEDAPNRSGKVTKRIPRIKAGMLARVHLPTGRRRNSLLVPKDALVLGGRTPMVFVVDRASQGDAAGTARPVPVTYGIAAGPSIVVAGELAEGQEVVVRGNERVRPGQPVNVIEVQETNRGEEAAPAAARPTDDSRAATR